MHASDLAGVWHDLVGGRVGIVGSYFSDDFIYLAIKQRQGVLETRPPDSCFRVLEDVLAGTPSKIAAMERAVTVSTVSTTCNRALQFMGLRGCMISKSSPLLSALVHAARGLPLALNARVVEIERAGRTVRAIAVPRLESVLADRLPPAEYAVVRMILEGMSHAEVACMRATSRRTVANQLAGAFRRFGVSGRADLIHYLVRCWSQPGLAAAS